MAYHMYMLRITLSIVLLFSLATLFNAGCDSNNSGTTDDSGGGSGGATSQPDRTIDDSDEDNGDNGGGDVDDSGIDDSGDSDDKDKDEMKPPAQKYSGPEFRIEIQTMESEPQQYVLSYEVTVSSGGYKLNKDDSKIENGHLELYLTLQKPGPEEIVTMALETHEGSHTTGTEKITSVEVYVKSIQRSVDNSKAEYALAASLPE